MVNEAVIVELDPLAQIVDFTVADGAAISKGVILELIDPRTASASHVASTGTLVVGIAAADKELNDGALNIGVHQKGVFDMTADTNAIIQIGAKVTTSGANTIRAMTDVEVGQSGQIQIGTALDAATAGEVIEVRVNL